VRAAAPLLQALPKKLAGHPRELHVNPDTDADGGPSAGISYGQGLSLSVYQEYITKDTPSGKPEVLTANDLLAATFGLGAVCVPSTYQGTAPSQSYDEKTGAVRRGGGMGPAGGNRSKNTVWFSCRIAETADEQVAGGQALGWTSGKTAWLIIGEQSNGVNSLVAALMTAR
jgi:hypothetical protein